MTQTVEPTDPEQLAEPVDPGKPLAPHVADRIIAQHASTVPEQLRRSLDGLPPARPGAQPYFEVAYRPADGYRVGTTSDAKCAARRHLFVIVPSTYLPTVEDLARVRVDPDGTVRWPE